LGEAPGDVLRASDRELLPDTQYKKGAPFGLRFGWLSQTIRKGTPFYD